MTVAYDDRYQTATPVTSTTEFLVDFPVFSATDITAAVSGVVPTFTTTGTFVDGVSTDFKVILATAISGETIEIWDQRQPRRDEDLINGPDLVKNVNASFDRKTAETQILYRDMSRALKVPLGESPANLPTLATRAEKYAYFNATGDLIGLSSPDDVISGGTVRFLATKAALQAASIDADIDTIMIAGQVSAGDGGGAQYKRVGSEPSHGGKIQSNDGAWFEKVSAGEMYQTRDATTAGWAAENPDGTIVWLGYLAYEVDSTLTGSASCTSDLSVNGLRPAGMVWVEHFGAVADNGTTDNADPINRAIIYAASGYAANDHDVVNLVGGYYGHDSQINYLTGVTLRGQGRQSTKLLADASMTQQVGPTVQGTSYTRFNMYEMWLDGNSNATYGIRHFRTTHSLYHNVNCTDQTGAGVYITHSCYYTDFVNVDCSGATRGFLCYENQSGSTGSNGMKFIRCRANNVTDGFVFQTTNTTINDCTFIDCVCETYTGHGIDLIPASTYTISQFRFHDQRFDAPSGNTGFNFRTSDVVEPTCTGVYSTGVTTTFSSSATDPYLSGTGFEIIHTLTHDFPSIAAGSYAQTTVAVSGLVNASDWIVVAVNPQGGGAWVSGMLIYGEIETSSTIKITAVNHTGGAVDAASQTFTYVLKRIG